jgi:hypothetical protein
MSPKPHRPRPFPGEVRYYADAEDALKDLFPSRAERYRRKASEVRAIAAEMNDIVGRRTLQRIADDYDRLAERAECREPERSGRPRGSR